ncbi:hypothetical protein [Aeromonas sp. FDAARGOS 1405]|uniref:hypothetical protein n=1 Tax=Aeromonas sp. FDAARGOS 1405 TaxID=2778054 RepID=UPI0020B215FD|nr:hypothetical protein [Aeromonas sp. FDAARGOS 1405]
MAQVRLQALDMGVAGEQVVHGVAVPKHMGLSATTNVIPLPLSAPSASFNQLRTV